MIISNKIGTKIRHVTYKEMAWTIIRYRQMTAKLSLLDRGRDTTTIQVHSTWINYIRTKGIFLSLDCSIVKYKANYIGNTIPYQYIDMLPSYQIHSMSSN